MAQITIDKTAQNNGLAAMIRDLISQNIDHHAERSKDLDALNGNIAIVTKDIDVSLTLECKKGSIVIYDGVKPPCKLKIETDSDNILKLSTLKIKAGLPYYFDRTGREVLGMLFNGKLKIQGLFAHPLLLTHLTKLFSVY
jgi:hypothetical protein